MDEPHKHMLSKKGQKENSICVWFHFHMSKSGRRVETAEPYEERLGEPVW
jgi:hypothetical protein